MAKISSRKSRGQPTTTKSATNEMPSGITLSPPLPPPSPNPNLPITNDVANIMNLLNRIIVVLENNQNEDLGDNQNNEKNPKNNNRRDKKPKNNNEKNMKPKDNKVKDFFKKMTDSTTKIIEKNSTSIRGAFLGPMNLLVKPFEEFFGGSVFEGMKSLVNKGKTLIQKFTKKKPNENDVVKAGVNGVGFLYLGGLIEKIFGKDKKGKYKDISGEGGISGFFKGLIGGSGKGVGAMAKGIGSKLLTALPIASLIIGLIWAVIDGVKGFFKAKDWGVSKISGVVGGVLAGTESGWKNAFKNAGKFALIGVGIGAVGGPIGMLIGGLVGGAIGGILGYFGGQKVANFFETHIKPYFTDTLFPAIKEYFFSIIGLDQLKAIGDIWKGEGSFMKKLGKTLVDVALWIFGLPWRIIKAMGRVWNKILIKPIVNLFKKVNWKELWDKIWTGLKNFFSPSNLKAIWDGMVKGIGDFFSGIWEGLKSFGNSVANSPFGEFVNTLFSTIGDSITDFLKNNPIGQWIDKWIISPIVGFFSTIGDFFGFIGSMGLGGLWEIATSKEVSFASKFDEYKASKETKVNDAIIRTDGSIIHTHPDDNIIATKNLPTNLDSLYAENNNNLNKNLSNLDSNVKVSEKLDKMVDLLERLLDKEPVNMSLPPQTRQDLDLLMNGGLL
jgi:hypothetical protein